MPIKKITARAETIDQVYRDDKALDKAANRQHSGDRAADALADAARDIDSEPYTR